MLKAYYTATRAKKFLTVYDENGHHYCTTGVDGLRDARKVCKEYGWTLWNV